MTNDVEAALVYNKGALEIIYAQFPNARVPRSPRNDLVWAYVSIAIKHHEGICALANMNLLAPAFALLRSQIETYYRALWANQIATDEQVNTIRGGNEKPFPKFRDMAAVIDMAYGAGGWLQSFADRWTDLNGYTHSGLEQLARQFRSDGTLGPNYLNEIVIALLVTSGTTSIRCIVLIFRHFLLDDKAAALEQWLAEYTFYRQTEEAAVPAENTPTS